MAKVTREELQAAVEHAWLMHPPHDWKANPELKLPLTKLYPRVTEITYFDVPPAMVNQFPWCMCRVEYGTVSGYRAIRIKITAPIIDPEFEWIADLHCY